MRKAITLVMVLVFSLMFIGCELDATSSPSKSLSPPNWIRGTWADEYGINNYTFSSNNVIFILDLDTTSIEIDFVEMMNSSETGVANESSTASTYSFSFNDGGTTSSLRFEYQSSTTINYYVSEAGVTTEPITLTKE